MDSPEDQPGAPAPPGESAPSAGEANKEDGVSGETHVSYSPVTDASAAHDAPYQYGDAGASVPADATPSTAVVPAAGGGGGKRPPPPPSDSDGGDEEDGMLRMSFLEHLEELRTRILRSLAGVAVAFVVSLGFCNELWHIVSAP